MYRESVDSALPQSAELNNLVISSPSEERALDAGSIPAPESRIAELSGLTIDQFHREAGADSVGLTKNELASALLVIGNKCNYGLAPGVQANRAQAGAFWRALQLRDLALAQACALGRDVAWRQFLARFREPLKQAAIGITRSAMSGTELAESLYSEMFGLTERDGQRRSPLASYSGRGSLIGFLRATLAQRNAGQHRRANREVPLAVEDMAAPPADPAPASDALSRLGRSLTAILRSLTAEERFLLSAWFLDRRTLAEIAQVLRVHESTMSRRIKRLTASLRKDLLGNLRAAGLSRQAAEEALGADPRDLDINIRSLLQASQPGAFLEQGESAEQEPA
jgi:RNA polymerase sigma-70 factor (ECF subfamily)